MDIASDDFEIVLFVRLLCLIVEKIRRPRKGLRTLSSSPEEEIEYLSERGGSRTKARGHAQKKLHHCALDGKCCHILNFEKMYADIE